MTTGAISATLRVLTATDQEAWLEVLGRSGAHDFYHLPQYHRMAEERGEGSARLFVYREGPHEIALPLLLRAIDGADPDGWKDATSIYGYGGPVSSSDEVPDSVVSNFQSALRATMIEERVVAAFSRLHPLLAQLRLLAGLGECRPGGQTVSIDLTLSPEAQRLKYSGSYRTRINKLVRNGVTCTIDPDLRHLAEFVELYHENMRRVNAHASYFFDADYFASLAGKLGSILRLFVARSGDELIAGGLFTLCRGIAQYHLGATGDAYLKLSPMALIMDTVRQWSHAQGARVLHLGGGVGAKEDSLFCFKAGFSDRRHQFETWRWVIAPDAYKQLCEARLRRNRDDGMEAASADYFPAYRCPAVPRVTAHSDP